ncbi:MAG: hypothetical protein CL424_12875 [Acidimicrobiaceae bacterium]|nr:hypothetical protein [Acidimicrobiaceae bacterium]
MVVQHRELDVIVDADCGNAPRKAQVRDWLTDVVRGDVDAACSALDDEIVWEIVGHRTRVGIGVVREALRRAAEERASRLTIRHLLSHGKQVAVEGDVDGDGFAHIVTFTGHGKAAHIAEVVTYRSSTAT